MRITRTVAMNPIEPQQMSLRVPNGMPLSLDLQYLDINGQVYTSDLAAQLQLTSRTGDQTTFHAAPATDIINGKARVTIGADVLTDINGYRLRLAGTYRGEATLLALGSLRITEAAGLQATPEDIIDDVPLYLSYAFDAAVSIRLWQDADKGAPFDLSTATITAAIYPSSADPTALVPFDVTTTATPGEVILRLTADQIATLPPVCWWSMRASTAGGVTTLCQGTVTIAGVQP